MLLIACEFLGNIIADCNTVYKYKYNVTGFLFSIPFRRLIGDVTEVFCSLEKRLVHGYLSVDSDTFIE